MKHILLVDDNLTNLKQAASLLKDDYKVSLVKSGEQAIEFLEKFSPDLILMDVEMPQMDGYETTRRIKSMPGVKRIPVIFLTGDHDIESEIKGFECGAVDYIRKPFLREIVLHRVALHLELYKYQQNLEQVLEEKTKELMETLVSTERMKTELDLAGKLQQSMLPKRPPQHDEFYLFAKMFPAKETCGDMYDFFLYEERYLVTAIGDASGKGIGAALFITQAKMMLNHVLNDVLKDGRTLDDALFSFNNELCKGNTENLFLTLFVSILDIQTGEFTYCNAAHNPPLMTDGKTDFAYLDCDQNFIIGGVENSIYKSTTMKLEPNTRIFFYTDGVTESQNHRNELFGEERLMNLLNSMQESINTMDAATNHIMKEIQNFCEGVPQSDDITLLMLAYNG